MDKGSCRLFTILNHNEKFRIVLYTPSCTELYDKLINGTYLPTKMELEFTKNEKTNH